VGVEGGCGCGVVVGTLLGPEGVDRDVPGGCPACVVGVGRGVVVR